MATRSKHAAKTGLLDFIAQLSGGIPDKGVFLLPETFGSGYIRSYDWGPLIKLSLIHYELREELTIRRPGVKGAKDMVTFSFRNLLPEKNAGNQASQPDARHSSVQVSSTDIDLEIFTPANTKRNTILIMVHTDLLKELLHQKEGHPLLDAIISGRDTYLYEEISSTEMQQLAARIFEGKEPEALADFYLKLKATELIYLFFAALLKREHITTYPVNAADVRMMYRVKEKLAADLSVVPQLTELTALAGMSESKMNRLFKQIFGSSIYHYFQVLRLNEAAHLIREQKLSVSEAGYRLGFSNLSHFSRLFEKHIGTKPKKYSLGSR